MNQQIAKKLRKQGHKFVMSDSTGGVSSGGTSTDGLTSSGESHESSFDKPFFTWFWEMVLGNSSEEYRREFYREMHCGHTIGPSPRSFGSPDIRGSSLPYSGIIENDLAFRLIFVMIPGCFFWLLHHGIRVALRKLRRPSYYERERERRIQLGITRRSIHMRKTVNKQPTIDEIRAAWNGARHSPEGALRLGGLLEDLECYVNNLTIGNEVEGYRGRRGGIKRHLQDKAPDLFEHYAALMRYKSIAKKFRQACEVCDPNPTDALLPMSSPPRPQKARTNWSEQIKQSKERVSASVGKSTDTANGVARMTTCATEERSEQIKQSGHGGVLGNRSEDVVQKGVKAWVLDGFMFAWRDDCWIKRASYETAIRVLRACENSVISLEAALALEIDPNFVTKEAVKRYGVMIEATTERLKKMGTKQAGAGIGPNESSNVGPKKSSEVNGENLVAGAEIGPKESSSVGPKESSEVRNVDKVSLAGGVSARVAAWLKRRTCA